jgi:hypothetical protein
MIARARLLVAAALVVTAFLNLWQLNQTLRWVKPREADAVVIWEDRLRFIRNELMKADYWRGEVGYMPAGVLQGRRRTDDDHNSWVQARYVMIPWNLSQDSLAAPYVVVDATRSAPPPEVPAGFTTLYQSKDGIVLLRKLPAQ